MKGSRDSAIITNGKFKFSGKVSGIANGRLSFEKSGRNNNDENQFSFFIEPKALVIEGSGDSLPLLTIKGSQLNDDDRILKKRLETISKWEETNDKLYGDAMKVKDKTLMDSLDEVYNFQLQIHLAVLC